MTPKGHTVYIATLVSIVLAVTTYLSLEGFSYYQTSMEERFYHPDHARLKPNGIFGHGLGIVGTLMILIGVFGYMIRKRWRRLSRIGVLKYWLEFHIFLCTLGPIMILFHTAFKFGGIVSISFWSMVAVVASGVLGRFIYLQIPRTKQGKELGLHELQEMKATLREKLSGNTSQIPTSTWDKIVLDSQEKGPSRQNIFQQIWKDYLDVKSMHDKLVQEGIPGQNIRDIINVLKREKSLNRKIHNLVTMQKYFRYWHVAHLPFAIIMLLIMIIHVGVTVALGYTWIF